MDIDYNVRLLTEIITSTFALTINPKLKKGQVDAYVDILFYTNEFEITGEKVYDIITAASKAYRNKLLEFGGNFIVYFHVKKITYMLTYKNVNFNIFFDFKNRNFQFLNRVIYENNYNLFDPLYDSKLQHIKNDIYPPFADNFKNNLFIEHKKLVLQYKHIRDVNLDNFLITEQPRFVMLYNQDMVGYDNQINPHFIKFAESRILKKTISIHEIKKLFLKYDIQIIF